MAATQTQSSITILRVSRSKVGEVQSWLPVHRYAPWDKQQSLPMRTGAKLSIQTSSPIHELSPTTSRQGNFTRRPGLMTTLLPISAPNSRSSHRRWALPGSQERTSKADTRIHSVSVKALRPRLNWELRKFPSSTRRRAADDAGSLCCKSAISKQYLQPITIAVQGHFSSTVRHIDGQVTCWRKSSPELRVKPASIPYCL